MSEQQKDTRGWEPSAVAHQQLWDDIEKKEQANAKPLDPFGKERNPEHLSAWQIGVPMFTTLTEAERFSEMPCELFDIHGVWRPINWLDKVRCDWTLRRPTTPEERHTWTQGVCDEARSACSQHTPEQRQDHIDRAMNIIGEAQYVNDVKAKRDAEARAVAEHMSRTPDDGKAQSKTPDWAYCPECGCDKSSDGFSLNSRVCTCGQEWFTDVDYSDTVRRVAIKRTNEVRSLETRLRAAEDVIDAQATKIGTLQSILSEQRARNAEALALIGEMQNELVEIHTDCNAALDNDLEIETIISISQRAKGLADRADALLAKAERKEAHE